MPRIHDVFFDAPFASRRDKLIATVRRNVPSRGRDLQNVCAWLDTQWSEEKVGEALKREQHLDKLRDRGQPYSPTIRSQPPGSSSDRDLPGDNLRADRIEHAFVALHRQNRSGELLRLLGSNLPRGERESNALRAVVMSACIIDPDAGEWLSSVTPLANGVWRGDQSAKPWVRGRADVARLWGYEALGLLQEACGVLGWEPAAESGARHEIAISAALKRYPTLLEGLIYLARRDDGRWIGDPKPKHYTILVPLGGLSAAAIERAQARWNKEGVPTRIAGEPLAFALLWLQPRASWTGADLYDFVFALADSNHLIDSNLRGRVLPQFDKADTPEMRNAFWSELFSRFPHIAADIVSEPKTPSRIDCELLKHLANRSEQGVAVADLPTHLMDANMLTVMDADGLIEFGHRIHYWRGKQLVVQENWEFVSVSGPDKKPMTAFVAESINWQDDERIRPHVRLTAKGRVEASRVAAAGTPEDGAQPDQWRPIGLLGNPDSATINAVRRVIADWDGVNWAAVRAVLEHAGQPQDRIRTMTTEDVRQYFAVGQKTITMKLGGNPFTADGVIVPVIDADGNFTPVRRQGAMAIVAPVKAPKAKRRQSRRAKPATMKQPRVEFMRAWALYLDRGNYQSVADELGIAKSTAFDQVKAVEQWIESNGTNRQSLRASVSLDSYGGQPSAETQPSGR